MSKGKEDGDPGGRWPWGRGSIVRTTETIRSEIFAPLIAGGLMLLLACLALFGCVLDSLIIGPPSWFALGAAALTSITAALLIKVQKEARVVGYVDWVWALTTIAAFIGLVVWLVKGYGLVVDIWPAQEFLSRQTPFHERLHNLSPWWKTVLQPVFVAQWFIIFAICIRLLVEIVDPGWSRRFEQEAQFVGARALWPFGNPFPNKVYEARIQELERENDDLHAQVEQNRVRQIMQVQLYKHNGKGSRQRMEAGFMELPFPARQPEKLTEYLLDLMLGLAELKEKQGSADTRGAFEYGYSQNLWFDLRDALASGGLVEYKPGSQPVPTDDFWFYAAQHVAQTMGEGVVPSQYQKYLKKEGDNEGD